MENSLREFEKVLSSFRNEEEKGLERNLRSNTFRRCIFEIRLKMRL